VVADFPSGFFWDLFIFCNFLNFIEMEKLSLEKFDASKMSKNQMFQTKGGGRPSSFESSTECCIYDDIIHEGGIWEITGKRPCQ
jgi:hypothetical protein